MPNLTPLLVRDRQNMGFYTNIGVFGRRQASRALEGLLGPGAPKKSTGVKTSLSALEKFHTPRRQPAWDQSWRLGTNA